MDAQREHESPHQPRGMVRRLINVLRRNTEDTENTDGPSSDRSPHRIDDVAPDWNPTVQPEADGPQTWSDVGAAQVPKSRAAGSEPVQLPESRAEPGGVPVYADPAMVNPAAAEKMRPLFRHNR